MRLRRNAEVGGKDKESARGMGVSHTEGAGLLVDSKRGVAGHLRKKGRREEGGRGRGKEEREKGE